MREWDELADRTEAMPWLRPGWILAWRRAYGQAALHLLGARRGRQLCAILRLQRWHGELRSPTNPADAPLSACWPRTAPRQGLALALLRRRQRGSYLRYLLAHGATFDELAAAASAAGVGHVLKSSQLAKAPNIYGSRASLMTYSSVSTTSTMCQPLSHSMILNLLRSYSRLPCLP